MARKIVKKRDEICKRCNKRLVVLFGLCAKCRLEVLEQMESYKIVRPQIWDEPIENQHSKIFKEYNEKKKVFDDKLKLQMKKFLKELKEK